MSNGNPIPLSSGEHLADKYIIEKELTDAVVCGSIRRQCVRVHDIDILVIDETKHGEIEKDEIADVPIQIYYTKRENHGAALLFLTGDKDFNIRMRGIAQTKGLKLNRYGLWDLPKGPYEGETLLASKTEEEILSLLIPEFIAPEHRGRPDGGIEGLKVEGSKGDTYEVFQKKLHGFDFCSCKGFKYRGSCRHLLVKV